MDHKDPSNFVYDPLDQPTNKSSAPQVITCTHSSPTTHTFKINNKIQYLNSTSFDSFILTIKKIIFDDFGDPVYGLWDPDQVRIWAVSSELTLASTSSKNTSLPPSNLSPLATLEIQNLLDPPETTQNAVLLDQIENFSPYCPTLTKLNSSEPSKCQFTLHDLH